MRSSSPRSLRQSARLLVLAVTISVITAAHAQDERAATPLHRFVERSLAAAGASQDTLAGSFSVAQVPLLARALNAREVDNGIDSNLLYDAIARWHFWMGKRWDSRNRGLWSADPLWLPVTGDPPGGTLAMLAALEMVQLGALSEMALRRGLVYDALVWSDDRARLAMRLETRLHDPLMGGYANLDSSGHRRSNGDRLSSLLPIALDVPFLRDRARALAWQLWCDRAPGSEVDAGARLQALDRAEQLHGWSGDAGLHLLDPELTAALTLVSIERLEDLVLRPVVKNALGSAGLAVPDSVPLRIGSWTVPVDPRGLSPTALHGSRTALRFLRDGGLVPPAEIDSLLARLYDRDLDRPALRDSLIEGLTERLVAWRHRDFREESRRWGHRTPFMRALVPEGSVFRWNEADLVLWADRALDRITSDILDHHLRPRPRGSYRARTEPQLAGRGDSVELVLEPLAAPLVPGQGWSVGWSDGTRLLPPESFTAVAKGDGRVSITVDHIPNETGMWTALLQGPPGSPHHAPAIAVVEPLRTEMRPIVAEGSGRRFQVDVISQVSFPSSGRLEIEPPLQWDLEPSPFLPFDLAPGGSARFDVTLTPDGETSPAIYPVRWKVFDADRLVADLNTDIAVHFRWLRLGALGSPTPNALDKTLGPDRAVDLAKRFQGPQGTEAWTRLNHVRMKADGWIELATGLDAGGVHYALTAFTTGSRDVVVQLESNVPALARVNGTETVRLENGGRNAGEAQLSPGTNFVLVKLVGGDARPARYRIELRDIDGEPIRGVRNELEHLLDGYAYITRTEEEPGVVNPVAVQRDQMRLVTIQYQNPAATRVFVVGSFNGWSPTATPMANVGGGRWEAKVRLRPGRFEYKFAVDGVRWIADPVNPINAFDGFGGRNSVIVVE